MQDAEPVARHTVRRWRELLGYIDLLPSTSWLYQAMFEDSEAAERQLKYEEVYGEDSSPARGPQLSEWSTEVQLLAQIADLLQQQIGLDMAVATQGKASTPFKPLPRPRGAADELRARKAEEVQERIREKFAPKQ